MTVVLVGCSRSPQRSDAQRSAAASTPEKTVQVSEGRRTAITAAVAAVSPSVVTVQTTTVQQTAVDPFSAFFGGGQSGTRTVPGLGTGFIVRSNGVIVTNAHVIAGASDISVMLRDGTVYSAKSLGTDEANDIAVIKIDAKDLPVAKLGNSSNLLIGEWAIAIGNPYGFMLGNSEPSVTAGVISGVGRNLVGGGEGSALYFDMIQTDASINPGNSGGPLVDADGEVVGVNSSIYSNNGGSIGLGFSIPINRVSRVVDDLLEHGSIRRPWIGVTLKHASDNPRDVIAAGATVDAVSDDSPAKKAGVQPGDVILKVGDRAIRNAFDWDGAQLDLRVGDPAQLTLKRGGTTTSVSVQVADLPEVNAPKVQVLKDLELVTVTPAIRAERGIRSTEGALIYNVTATLSGEIGVQKGDVVIGINNYAVKSADDAKKMLDYFAGKSAIYMVLERGGQRFQTSFVIR